MPSLWIVAREESRRRALARLAGATDAVMGGPGDPLFDEAPAPEVVLLGLDGRLETELEFAHRFARRLRDAVWLLVGDAPGIERGRRLFDSVPAVFLEFPPEAAALRAAVSASATAGTDEPLPLSQRPARDALSERFGRAFSDLELPELLRALDPRLAEVPVLVLGEPGTGRGTLVRYLHHFGGTAGGALVEIECRPESTARDLHQAMAASSHNPRSRRACTLWLVDVEHLAPALQRRVSGWIEFGPDEGAVGSNRVRWIASGRERGLAPELRQALSGITLRIPPLRERPELLANLANEIARAWCEARGVAPRRLGEHALAVLEEYPWPGNLRELEAVVEQSLAASAADPLGAEDLVMEGSPFAPLLGTVPEYGLEAAPPEPRVPATLVEEPVVEAERAAFEEALGMEDADFVLEALEPFDEESPPLPPLAADGEALPLMDPDTGEMLRVEEEEPPAPAPTPAPAPVSPEAPAATSPAELSRLAAAIGQEVRSPLTALRALAELLPERYRDADFRNELARLAGDSAARVEAGVSRLEQLAAFPPPEPHEVDVGGLIEEVLDKRRGRIHERRLLVLEELDRGRPRAHCDPEQLRFAIESLLDAAIELVPERGHIYLASKRNAIGLRGGPSVRALLRFRGPQLGNAAAERPEVGPAADALDVIVAEMIVRAQRGTLTVDASDRSETLIIVDLPS